jgi:hypothetical protein
MRKKCNYPHVPKLQFFFFFFFFEFLVLWFLVVGLRV